jgi:MoaA/NifB/PqqE/SkfB family radical SAM enzyme
VQCDYWKAGRDLRGFAPDGELELDEIESLAAEIAASGGLVVHLLGGEPLLREDLPEIIGCLHKENLRVGLTTNGWLLKPAVVDDLVKAGLNRVLLSIDHPDGEVHDAFRGRPGLFDRNIDTIRYIVSRYRPVGLRLEVNTVLHAKNFRDVARLSRLLGELGVSGHNLVPIMSFPPLKEDELAIEKARELYFQAEQIPELVGRIDDYFDNLRSSGLACTTTQEMLRRAVDFYAGHHRKPICNVGAISCDIYSNGDVAYCLGSGIRIGNIRLDRLRRIWRSRQAADVRRVLHDCVRCVDSCQADLRQRFSPVYVATHFPAFLREAREILLPGGGGEDRMG